MKPRLLPSQRQLISQGMRQYMLLLQMNAGDLKEWLEEEINKNPILEWEPKAQTSDRQIDVTQEESFFEALLSQAREAFEDKEEVSIAEAIISNLDSRMLFIHDLPLFANSLRITLEKLEKVLKIVQTFEPSGVAASSLQMSLLHQLRQIGKADSLCYRVVQDHYPSLMKGKFGLIKKAYKISDEIFKKEVLLKLKKLRFFPSSSGHAPYIYPDLKIKKENDQWIIEIEENLPHFQVKKEYSLFEKGASHDEKRTIRSFLAQGKWLMRMVNRRRKLLLKIGMYIVNKQIAFLEGKAALSPLSIKEIAAVFGLHPATLSRAFKDKYVETHLGIKPLRFFLAGDYSNKAALEMLKKLLEKEDAPCSDLELVQKLKEKGISLSRRTVQKYRQKLNLPSKRKRKLMVRE